MAIDITEQKENKLLDRIEVRGTLGHAEAATPTRRDLQAAIAVQFKTKLEHVEIFNISSRAGMSSSEIRAYVWHKKTVPIEGTKAETAPAEKKAA